MALQTINGPAAAVFTSSDAVIRRHLRLADHEVGENGLIDEIIASATGQIEAYLRLRLITQTVQLVLDRFGFGGIGLPIGPIQSVSQIAYVDGAGANQPMAATDFRLVRSSVPAELHPGYGMSWPVPRPDRDAVKIDLVVGYGNAGANVPPPIRAALRHMVVHDFNNAEGMVIGEGAGCRVAGILKPLRLWL